MKTIQPNLHSRIDVITLQERDTFEITKQYYVKLGYPTEIAEQYAYDHQFINRKGVK